MRWRRRTSGPTTEVTREEVALAYETLLGRSANPGEIAHYLAAVRTSADLVESLRGSEEHARYIARIRPPRPGPVRVNTWHRDLAAWTHPAGTESEDGVAIVGHEGWVFLQGGTNNNVAQFTGQMAMPELWAEAWTTLVERRRAALAERGLSAVFLVVPEKLAVVPHLYPAPLERVGPRPIDRLRDECGLPIVYPLAELQDEAVVDDVYLRTDTHLTYTGNHVLHISLFSVLGVEPLPWPPPGATVDRLGSGDLGSRFDPPILEPMTSPGGAQIPFILAEDNRSVVASLGGHIGSRRVYRNAEASDGRRVVVFGDSYGMGDGGYQGICWFLAQAFREVHFLWAPFGWDPSYIDRVEASLVIFETAERFIVRVPAPEIDITALAAAAERQSVAVDAILDPRHIGA